MLFWMILPNKLSNTINKKKSLFFLTQDEAFYGRKKEEKACRVKLMLA